MKIKFSNIILFFIKIIHNNRILSSSKNYKIFNFDKFFILIILKLYN